MYIKSTPYSEYIHMHTLTAPQDALDVHLQQTITLVWRFVIILPVSCSWCNSAMNFYISVGGLSSFYQLWKIYCNKVRRPHTGINCTSRLWLMISWDIFGSVIYLEIPGYIYIRFSRHISLSRPHTDREIDDEVRFTRLDGETESGQSPGYDWLRC